MNADFNSPHRSLSQHGLSSIINLCSPISFVDPLSSFVAEAEEEENGITKFITIDNDNNNYNNDRSHPLYDDSDRYIAPRAAQDVSLSNYLLTSKENCNPLQMFSPRMQSLSSAHLTHSHSMLHCPFSPSLRQCTPELSTSPSLMDVLLSSRSRSNRRERVSQRHTSRSISPLVFHSNKEKTFNQESEKEEYYDDDNDSATINNNNINNNNMLLELTSSPLLAVQECEPFTTEKSEIYITEDAEQNDMNTYSPEISNSVNNNSPQLEIEHHNDVIATHNDNKDNESDHEELYYNERRKRQKSEAAISPTPVPITIDINSSNNNNNNNSDNNDEDNYKINNTFTTLREASPLPHPPPLPHHSHPSYNSFLTSTPIKSTPPPKREFARPAFSSADRKIMHSGSRNREGSLFSSFKVEKRLFSPTPSHSRIIAPSHDFTCTNANNFTNVFRKLHLDDYSLNAQINGCNNINTRGSCNSHRRSSCNSNTNNHNNHNNNNNIIRNQLYEDDNSPENSYAASQSSSRHKIQVVHSSSMSRNLTHDNNYDQASHTSPREPSLLSMSDIEPYTSKLARTLFSDLPQVSVLGLHNQVNDFTRSCSSAQSCYPNHNNNNNHNWNCENEMLHHGNGISRGRSETSAFNRSLRVVYDANKARNFQSSTFRIIAQTPERILDAADLIDDFYLNLIDWSATSDVLAVALQSVVYLWDASSGSITPLPTNKTPRATITTNSITNTSSTNASTQAESNTDRLVCGLQWAADGTSLAIGLQDGTVEVWNVPTQQVIHSWKEHTGRVGALSWMNTNNNNYSSSTSNHNSVESNLLASGSKDAAIHIHDIRDRASRRGPNVGVLHSHEQEVCGLKWSPNNTYLASGGNDNQLLIWDRRAFSCNERLSSFVSFPPHNTSNNSSNNSNSSNGNNTISLWQPNTTPVWCLNEHKAAVKALAWNPTCSSLLASGGGTEDKMLRFWNVHTGQCIRSVNTQSQVCGVLWNHAGNELVSSHGYSLNQLIIWKYPSLRQVAQLHGHTSRVLHLCLSKDGQTVVSAAGDETIRFWRCFPPAETSTRGTSRAKERVYSTRWLERSQSSRYSPLSLPRSITPSTEPITNSNDNNSNSSSSRRRNQEPVSPSPFMFSRDRARYLQHQHNQHHHYRINSYSSSNNNRDNSHFIQNDNARRTSQPQQANNYSVSRMGSTSPNHNASSEVLLLLSSESESEQHEEEEEEEELEFKCTSEVSRSTISPSPSIRVVRKDVKYTSLSAEEEEGKKKDDVFLSIPPPLPVHKQTFNAQDEEKEYDNDNIDNDNHQNNSLFISTPIKAPHSPSPLNNTSSEAATLIEASRAADIMCDELVCESIALR